MVRIYSPFSSLSSASGAHLFAGPGFHVPMLPPPPPPPPLNTAAPYAHLDYHDPPPPSHHHSHLFPPPPPPPPSHRPGHHLSAFEEPMMPLVFANESAAPDHFFVSRSHSPPPSPASIHGHHQPFGLPSPPCPSTAIQHGHHQPFGSPPPPPPPPSLGHGKTQRSRKPVSWGPMHSPPAHDRGAPFYGHDSGYHGLPPPPHPSLGHHHLPPPLHDHGNGYPPQFSRHVIHEPMLSPPPAHHSEASKLFGRHNHSPPASPSFHGHRHPPAPPFHSAHSHSHHSRHVSDRPHGFPKGMRSFPPDLEPAAPSMFMSHEQFPPPPLPPPPHLDYYKSSHSRPSSPVHHAGASHYTHQFGRRPALGFEAPHSFMDHLHGSHSPPPPPPPPPPPTHGSHPPALESEVSHSFIGHVHGSRSPSPLPPPPPSLGHPPALGAGAPPSFIGHFHGSNSPPPPPPMHSHNTRSSPFQDRAAECCAQRPMESPEVAEALHHRLREPFTSGVERHHPHHFPGHADGMRERPQREDDKEHPLPHHNEFDAAGPRSAPRRPAPCSFCAPLVPAAHLSHAYRAHMAVPVW